MFYFNTDNQNTSFIRNLQVISGEGGTPYTPPLPSPPLDPRLRAQSHELQVDVFG